MRKTFGVLLAILLIGPLFVPVCPALSEVEHTVRFFGLAVRPHDIAFPYSDSYFDGNPSMMNPALAYASMVLSAAAYDQTLAMKGLKVLGFPENIRINNRDVGVIKQQYYDFKSFMDNGYSAVTLGFKSIEIQGEKNELFIVLIRGTKDYEWQNNFNIGKGNVHEGFNQAMQGVQIAFQTWYFDLQREGIIDRDSSNNILWITGHSRGGAAANLLAATYNSKEQGFILRDELYAYTFACPNVVTGTIDNKYNENIHNFFNPYDFVSNVPFNADVSSAWAYKRYGTDFNLVDNCDEQSMMDNFTNITNIPYMGATKESNANLMPLLLVLAPSPSLYPLGLFERLGYVLANEETVLNWFEAVKAYIPKQVYETKSKDIKKDTNFVIQIAHAHCTESYLAWMQTLNGINSGNAKDMDIALMKRILGMTASDAAALLGGNYVDEATGGEGSLDGFGFPDLGITLSFLGDPNKVIVRAIYLFEGRSISNAAIGMTPKQLTVILGEPAKIYWGDEGYPLDVYVYHLGDLQVEFIASGKEDDPTSYAIVELWKEKPLSTKVGDIVYFGKYEQDNNTGNGKEDIGWKVLTKENGRALLVSDKVLDCRAYGAGYGNGSWETHVLRKWLNGEFLSTAFSQEESERITITTLMNTDSSLFWGTERTNDTQDRIFLLSRKEVEEYFVDAADRRAVNTAYAREKGVYDVYGFGVWWLRSPGEFGAYGATVEDDGSFFGIGLFQEPEYGGIRPALWVMN